MNDKTLTNIVLRLQSQVVERLNLAKHSINEDSDLFALGLDSLSLMSLVSQWRSQGIDVNFSQLAKTPTLIAWARQIRAGEDKLQQAAQTSLNGLPNNRIGIQPHAPFLLAPMQYAYWVGRNKNQPLGGVAAHLYCEFQLEANKAAGFIDPVQLEKAINQLVKRHSSLRLIVDAEGNQIHPATYEAYKVMVTDLTQYSQSDAENELQRLRALYSSQMLDIEAGEVFSLALSLLPDGGSRLHFDIDMVAADALSYRTLLKELATLYRFIDAPLAELPLSYKDCRTAANQQEAFIKETSGKWWQSRIAKLPEGPKLPLVDSLNTQPNTTRRHFHFDQALKLKFYELCKANGVTPSSALATVLAETIAGWCVEPRFLLNVPLFQRPMGQANVSGVAGDFSSSILVDVDATGPVKFSQLAQQLQTRMHEDAAHANYSGVHVLRDLGRAKGKQVTAPVVFTSALNLGELFAPVVADVFGEPIWIISQGPQVLLDAQVTELNAGVLVNWDCREDAFEPGVLDDMFAYFRQTVESLASNPSYWQDSIKVGLPQVRTKPRNANVTASRQVVVQKTPPRNPLEQTVAALWQGVLECEEVFVEQDLFAAGGDSVLASALIAQLREVFGNHAMDMKKLFCAPTIAGISDTILTACDSEEVKSIAQVYCEILSLDDEALAAQLEAQI
ncbi:Phenyloxazoline synthase MbtB [Pseudoalteromonas sp. CIP111854]|uniref:Phenyloxazoline synthase MbtB n=1 Tax=Pseudoalteromonas holothuriae TaxID=2963714 RepID=A0A9W4QSG9_9GAMM|nr:condensation domain-containing protein [Pseudoalteromonas sp. CIP111854]CAH9051216.1 Phenyloxazoline synthase MbtB [Pseudoalteromonas sp. CIP111854]